MNIWVEIFIFMLLLFLWIREICRRDKIEEELKRDKHYWRDQCSDWERLYDNERREVTKLTDKYFFPPK